MWRQIAAGGESEEQDCVANEPSSQTVLPTDSQTVLPTNSQTVLPTKYSAPHEPSSRLTVGESGDKRTRPSGEDVLHCMSRSSSAVSVRARRVRRGGGAGRGGCRGDEEVAERKKASLGGDTVCICYSTKLLMMDTHTYTHTHTHTHTHVYMLQ